ncbi:GNAT family protein [Kitasatospora sp. CM 4170]|uniref:GNAT family protein n=1 Tax=Kitasatospora aburaviensis TaxID=67265 RepID=A0ABW1F912_9ACTN|nr:GNAT family protein [Kitasatospora sp. CM 4170]WNM49357.1 GNAT family protein [Kitasatospora sp. CM 4170]
MSTVESTSDQRAFVPVTLDLGDIVLRPWGRRTEVRGGVVARLLAASVDPAIALWNPIRATDEAGAAAYLDRWETGWDSGNTAAFAVVDSTDSDLLGNVALRWTDRADGLAMIGYWLLPAARGRGVATRATRAVTSWGIATADTRRIEIAHAVGNAASCRVAERCGYPAEGTLRASHRFGDGEYHDEHLHARLATDPEPA